MAARTITSSACTSPRSFLKRTSRPARRTSLAFLSSTAPRSNPSSSSSLRSSQPNNQRPRKEAHNVSTVDVSSGAAYAGREANHALSFRQFNKSKHAQYFTPLWLSDLLFDVLQSLVPSDGPAALSVLDPTCGSGRLLAPWKLAGCDVLGIELDELAADHARFAVGASNV